MILAGYILGNLHYLKDFSSLFFSRIIRYEDLMSDLDGQIPQFLSSLGLPMQASVKSFLYRNTSPSEIRYCGVEILSEKNEFFHKIILFFMFTGSNNKFQIPLFRIFPGYFKDFTGCLILKCAKVNGSKW